MKRQKVLVWIGIIAICLPAGYLGRGYLHEQNGRAQSAIDLFSDYCVPFSRRDLRVPNPPFVAIPALGSFAWADPYSVMLLQYSDRNCSVSDVLLPMNAKERSELDAEVPRLIKREMPELYPDNEHGLDSWSAFQVWESHPRTDDRRRGVVYSRVSTEANSETSLSFSYPINDGVSENLRKLKNGS